LVVDDQRDAAFLLRRVLERLGQQVCVAEDGRTALVKAREFHPQVVLCDIVLPDIDGYDVARSLRAEPDFVSVYLVALSGCAEEEDRRRAAQAGFDYHLAKPVDINQFQHLLARFPRFSRS
jgi:CheY-like chemotaxis protein